MLNPKYDEQNSVYVSPRAFDDLRWVPEDPKNPHECAKSFMSDVRILLNSERIINTLGEDVYRSLINSMVPKKSPYQDSAIPDDALFMVKPRHCQEHSEIRAWSRYIFDKMDSLVASEKEKMELQKQAELKQAESKSTELKSIE